MSAPAESHDASWLLPVAAVVIVLATAAGVVLSFVFADGMLVTSTSWIIFGTLLLVAASEFVMVRWVILPAQFAALADGRDARQPAIESAITTLIFAFSIAPAIYGVVTGILTGWAWPPPLFGAIAFVTLLAYRSYADPQMRRLRTNARISAAE